MSRTRHSTKAPGWEVWSRRPSKGFTSAGRETKRITHRLERRAADRSVRKDIIATDSEPQ